MRRTKFRRVVFVVTAVGEGRDGGLEGHIGAERGSIQCIQLGNEYVDGLWIFLF